jgi:hypothetical protein
MGLGLTVDKFAEILVLREQDGTDLNGSGEHGWVDGSDVRFANPLNGVPVRSESRDD